MKSTFLIVQNNENDVLCIMTQNSIANGKYSVTVNDTNYKQLHRKRIKDPQTSQTTIVHSKQRNLTGKLFELLKQARIRYDEYFRKFKLISYQVQGYFVNDTQMVDIDCHGNSQLPGHCYTEVWQRQYGNALVTRWIFGWGCTKHSMAWPCEWLPQNMEVGAMATYSVMIARQQRSSWKKRYVVWQDLGASPRGCWP